MGHRVADPEIRQAVGLGEGAQQNDVFVLVVGVDAIHRFLIPDELDVGLIQDHQHVLRNACQEIIDLGLGEYRSGRVIRGAQQDH